MITFTLVISVLPTIPYIVGQYSLEDTKLSDSWPMDSFSGCIQLIKKIRADADSTIIHVINDRMGEEWMLDITDEQAVIEAILKYS